MNVLLSVIMLRIEYIDNNDSWNRALNSFNKPHFLQTPQWGDVKSRYGWNSLRVAMYLDSKLLSVALILIKTIPIIKTKYIYCPRGPIFDTRDPAEVDSILKTLKYIAKENNAVSIKIDSELGLDDNLWKEALLSNKWRKGSEIQFRNTAIVDLTEGEDDLLINMKKKGRYNIKIASKKGVEIRYCENGKLDNFFQQYTDTGIRNNFITRSKEYYMDVAKTFINSGIGNLFTAYHEGELLAAAFVVTLKHTAWYFYGSSSNNKRNLMPTYLLHWEIIKWLKKSDIERYDMWGAPEILSKEDSMYGVYKFKENLGASFTEQAGAYDLILKPLSSFFLVRVIPMIQRLKKSGKKGIVGILVI